MQTTLTTCCATKFGLRGFTQALAKELTRIKVYAVTTGMTATRMTGAPLPCAKTIADVPEGRSYLPSGSDVDL